MLEEGPNRIIRIVMNGLIGPIDVKGAQFNNNMLAWKDALTDDQIAKKLDDNGIHVTRRTVAKYREDMRIPSTHQRRVKS